MAFHNWLAEPRTAPRRSVAFVSDRMSNRFDETTGDKGRHGGESDEDSKTADGLDELNVLEIQVRCRSAQSMDGV